MERSKGFFRGSRVGDSKKNTSRGLGDWKINKNTQTMHFKQIWIKSFFASQIDWNAQQKERVALVFKRCKTGPWQANCSKIAPGCCLLPRKQTVWFTWKSPPKWKRDSSEPKLHFRVPVFRFFLGKNRFEHKRKDKQKTLKERQRLKCSSKKCTNTAEVHHHDSGQCFRSSNRKRKSNFLLPLTNHSAQAQVPPVASLRGPKARRWIPMFENLTKEFFNGKIPKHRHFRQNLSDIVMQSFHFFDDIFSKSAPATSATLFFKSEAPASRASHLEVRPTIGVWSSSCKHQPKMSTGRGPMILRPANLATTSMCLTHVFNRIHSIYLLAAHDTMTHDLGASMHVKGLQVRSIKHSSLAVFWAQRLLKYCGEFPRNGYEVYQGRPENFLLQ